MAQCCLSQPELLSPRFESMLIRFDSLAAIDALGLNKPAPSHHLVDKVHVLLANIARSDTAATVTARWVPSHMALASTSSFPSAQTDSQSDFLYEHPLSSPV